MIAIVGPDGQTTNLRTPLAVDGAMRAALGADPAPERRFRFAAPCAERGCGHWRDGAGAGDEAGGRCGLIARVRHHVAASGAAPAPPPGLQPCAIRARCRWWQQDGAAACRVCRLVTYNRPA